MKVRQASKVFHNGFGSVLLGFCSESRIRDLGLRRMSFWIWDASANRNVDFELRVEDSGFRVDSHGSGFRGLGVEGLGLMIWSL